MLFEDSFAGALFLFGTVVGAALMCLLLQQVNQLLPKEQACHKIGCRCRG